MTFCKYCHKAIDDNEIVMNEDENGNGYHHRCLFEKEAHDNAKRVVVIPDNATNGDAIKAMFPNFRQTDHFELTETCEIIYLRNGEEICEIRCSKEWWNALYKAESEEKK